MATSLMPGAFLAPEEREVLCRYERTLVRILERNGGSMRWEDLRDAARLCKKRDWSLIDRAYIKSWRVGQRYTAETTEAYINHAEPFLDGSFDA